MDEADREKTVFVTQGGLFEFMRMTIGLANAGATFERLMERALTWLECLLYFDDILVFGSDFATTLDRLTKVGDCLGEAGLKLKAQKTVVPRSDPDPWS